MPSAEAAHVIQPVSVELDDAELHPELDSVDDAEPVAFVRRQDV